MLDETTDDLRIYVGYLPAEATVQGRAGPHYWRTNETGPTQPLVGFASLHLEADVRTAMHEIGHVLGIGGVGWRSRQGLLAGEGEDRHLTDARARAAWSEAGGARWSGPAVPVAADDAGCLRRRADGLYVDPGFPAAPQRGDHGGLGRPRLHRRREPGRSLLRASGGQAGVRRCHGRCGVGH